MRSLRWLLLSAAIGCAPSHPSSHERDAGAPDTSAPEAALDPSEPDGWDQEIRLPRAKDENSAENVVEVSLTAKVVKVPTGPHAVPVERWTYDGSVPGPFIRAKVGDRVRVHFHNQLPEATTIHWHGIEVPAAMDGADPSVPPVQPGESFDYEFVVPHAGTYWYHPHVNSAVQVWRGLFGAFIVDGAAEPALGNEAVLVLNDTDIKDGKLAALDPNDELTAFFGQQGNIMQVNGRTLPSLKVRAGAALRLRVINAALSRYFLLAAENEVLTRVGGDSGFFDRPEVLESVLVVPGERAELVLVPHGQVGTSFLLQSLPFDRYECGGPCEPAPRPLLRIEITAADGSAPEMPAHLADIAPIATPSAIAHHITFTQDQDSGRFGLNGKVYPDDPLVIEAESGDTDVWTLDNQTDYDHPFHLHGFRFQVLEQAGSKPTRAGWKDTLNIARHTKSRIAVHFDDRPGMWMLHCHILGHAELGMMGMLHLMSGSR